MMTAKGIIRNGYEYFKMSRSERHLHSLESNPGDPFLIASISHHRSHGHPHGRGLYMVDLCSISRLERTDGNEYGYNCHFLLNYDSRNYRRAEGSLLYYISMQIERDENGDYYPKALKGVVGREKKGWNIPPTLIEPVALTRAGLDRALAVMRLFLKDDFHNDSFDSGDIDTLCRVMKQIIKHDIELDCMDQRPVIKPQTSQIKSDCSTLEM